jgi:hypothetical protein
MNRKNLTAAVLAGLAGAAGIASTAQAVNMNPDGLGQVLIYPYYTVNGGNVTLLSVVNTTGQGKAVKVRFLEGMNSIEVLDFNLYMSEYDVWAGAIIPDGDDGAALTVTDTSCTVPTIEGQDDNTQEFLTLAYAGGTVTEGDGGPDGRDRLTEGYFEMIEMGTIEEGSPVETATTHITDPTAEGYGYPADCDAHVGLWSIRDDVVGAWLEDADLYLEPPTGGLFGGAAVVNAMKGSMYSYDARALQGYSMSIQHSVPGETEPNLGTGDVFTATVFLDDGATYEFDGLLALDAVSAVFMHDAVMNEYNTEDLGNDTRAASEWVVTFPTKRDYVEGTAREPFTSVWSDTDEDGVSDGACEIVKFGPGEYGLWNREEETIPLTPPDPDNDDPVFSPSEIVPPDEVQIPTSNLCYEVNVIRFGALPEGADPDTYAGPSEILGSSRLLNINNTALGFENGWASINMLDADNPNDDEDDGLERYLLDSSLEPALGGLPVTGFWLSEFQNQFAPVNLPQGEAGSGTATQHYGGIFNHKGTRMVSTGSVSD